MAEDAVGRFNGVKMELSDDITIARFIQHMEGLYDLPEGGWVLMGNRCLAVFSSQFPAPKLTVDGEEKLKEMVKECDKNSVEGALYFQRMGRIDPEAVFEKITSSGELPKVLHINPPKQPARRIVKPGVFPRRNVI
tara:strand:+ start:604 stop:1011 length:408 start_codon:yes stop_codon:yes gene_type:complete